MTNVTPTRPVAIGGPAAPLPFGAGGREREHRQMEKVAYTMVQAGRWSVCRRPPSVGRFTVAVVDTSQASPTPAVRQRIYRAPASGTGVCTAGDA